MTISRKLFIAAVVAGMGSAAMAQEQVIKIGHIGPVSGPQAHFGKDNENGVRMAIEDLNAKGMEIGGKKVKFQLVAEDDAADPKQGTAASQKLCDDKVAGAATFLNSGVAIPSSKVFHNCGIPMITGAATNPELTKPGWNTTYRVIANDNALGAALADYVAKVAKLKTVAVVDDRTAYGQGLASVFKKEAEKQGVKVVASEFTNDKATDFMAILTSLKGKQPEAIFYGGYAPQAAPMARQMKQLGISAKLLGGDTLCSPEVAKLAGDAVNDFVYCAYAGMLMDANDTTKAFQDKFKKRFGQNPDVYGPAYYDQVMFIGEAMQKSGSIDPAKVGDWMRKNPYKGVLGEYGYDDKGNRLKAPTVVNTFKGGKPTPVASH